MGNNSSSAVKKYGNAGTKRGRFNPNPTACNHPSCVIALQSKRDKKLYETSPRKVIYGGRG